MKLKLLIVAIFVAAISSVSAAPASAAATWNCEASAIRASVLGQQTLEPVVANRGETLCKIASGLSTTGLPSPLTISTLAASTGTEGSTPATQVVNASGGVADIGLRLLPDLPITLPKTDVINNLPPLTVDLSAIPIPPVPPGLTLPTSLTLDLKPLLSNALSGYVLPTTDLLKVRSAVAYASGRCTNNVPAFDGSSRVAGVSLLGQDLPVDGVVNKAVELISGKEVDPSTFDAASLVPATIDPLLVPLVTDAIQQALDALPNIQVPATIANISLIPGDQQKSSAGIVQHALTMSASILGQRLADTTIGEAIVGQREVVCATNSVGTTPAALQCTTRRLVLIDVFERNGRVQLLGAADKRYIGKRVNIVFTHTRKAVASAVVGRDGYFKATAPLPARNLRRTNLARYQAQIDKEKSLPLKLHRRMTVRSVRVLNGSKVLISGQVTRPLAAPARTITITRRVSCTKSVVVARVRPRSDGTFSVTVTAPPRTQSAVYRLATRVRKTRSNPKTFPTFTLPRYVDLA